MVKNIVIEGHEIWFPISLLFFEEEGYSKTELKEGHLIETKSLLRPGTIILITSSNGKELPVEMDFKYCHRMADPDELAPFFHYTRYRLYEDFEEVDKWFSRFKNLINRITKIYIKPQSTISDLLSVIPMFKEGSPYPDSFYTFNPGDSSKDEVYHSILNLFQKEWYVWLHRFIDVARNFVGFQIPYPLSEDKLATPRLKILNKRYLTFIEKIRWIIKREAGTSFYVNKSDSRATYLREKNDAWLEEKIPEIVSMLPMPSELDPYWLYNEYDVLNQIVSELRGKGFTYCKEYLFSLIYEFYTDLREKYKQYWTQIYPELI